MSDRYVVVHESLARKRKLPEYEDPPGPWNDDSAWVLFECDDSGKPVRCVFRDRMESEDAILLRDLRPLVEELNALADRRPAAACPGFPRFEWTRSGRQYVACFGPLSVAVEIRGSKAKGLRYRVGYVFGNPFLGDDWHDTPEAAMAEAETIAKRAAADLAVDFGIVPPPARAPAEGKGTTTP